MFRARTLTTTPPDPIRRAAAPTVARAVARTVARMERVEARRLMSGTATINVDFAFDEASITQNPVDSAYLDANNNGKLDSGETVGTPTDTGFTFALTLATNAPATFNVRQVVPAGFKQVDLVLDNDGATEGSGTGPGGLTARVTLGGYGDTADVTFFNVALFGTVEGTVTDGLDGLDPAPTVYADVNNNKKLDAGEPSTTAEGTDAAPRGGYELAGVPARSVTLRQVLPAGYTQVDPTGGRTVAVADGQTTSGVNFVDDPHQQTISGTVYLNRAPFAGRAITIYLDQNRNGKLDAGEAKVTTATDGTFAFAGLSQATYYVRQAVPAGYVQVETDPEQADGAGPIQVVAGETRGADLGFYDQAVTGDVFGSVRAGLETSPDGVTVYADLNDNRKRDAGEPSDVVGSGDDDPGTYDIPNVPVGRAVIRQVLPAGWTQVSPAGGLGAHVTVTAGGSVTAAPFVDDPHTDVIAGQVDLSVDGELVATGPDATFYVDANNNGKLDAGERTAKADGGQFEFDGLGFGTYRVRQVVTGFTQVTPARNGAVTVTFADADDLQNVEFADAATAPTGTPLTGKLVGTSGSFRQNGNTIAKAVDRDLSTFFDGPTANGNYVGYDLGTARVIQSVAFAPRPGYEARMVGGKVQGSASPTFANPVTLYTVTAAPTAGILNVAAVPNAAAYRYVRYLGPNGSYGNVAELAFYGKVTPLTGTTTGTAGSFGNRGNTIAKATDGDLATFFDGPTANGNSVGLDLGTARAVAGVLIAPRGGYADRMVGGKIQVSTSATFGSGVTTLYTITTPPADDRTLTPVTFAAPVSARYVRYLAADGSYGNVAEFQVFA